MYAIRSYYAHQGNQQEQQFARIHVAEQPHTVRHGFRSEFDDLHRQVGNVEQRVITERRADQFMHPATEALYLDVVEKTDQQDTDRQAQRPVQISGRDYAQVVVRIAGEFLPQHGQQIDRQKVHRVHRENPEEHSQCQWSDETPRLLSYNFV